MADPTRLSDDLGGEAEFRRLRATGLGVVLDVVPNRMAAREEENPARTSFAHRDDVPPLGARLRA